MVRNMVVAITDADGTERATHRIQYGARMHVDEGDMVKRGQRIAEWDPYTPAGSDRSRGHHRVRGSGRGPVDLGNARRIHRYRQARRHRLARVAGRGGSASGHRRQGQGRQGPEARAWRRGPLHAVGRRAFCRSTSAPRSRPATSSRVSPRKAPRPATSPAVCRGWPNCSRLASRRTRRSSRKSRAPSASAATTRTSAASRSSRWTRPRRPAST